MKKYIICILLLGLLFVACDIKDIKDDNKLIEEIPFDLEKIQLSKSFHNVEPFTEILNSKSEKFQILVSLGLSQYTDLFIDRVLVDGDDLNIYVTCKTKGEELVIPQGLISISSRDLDDIKSYNINIINPDYEGLEINLGEAEAIQKAENLFKITSNSSPQANLIKEGDLIYWNILYNMTFEKDDTSNSLYRFFVRLDANTGKVLEENKVLLSNPIDEGSIVDYVLNKYLLYEKKLRDEGGNITSSELWVYDIVRDKKDQLFLTKSEVSNGKFSPDFKNILFLKFEDKETSLHIIDLVSKNSYRLPLDLDLNLTGANWKDRDNIYLIETDKEESNILLYNIKNKEVTDSWRYKGQICQLRPLGERFIFTSPSSKLDNRDIFLTEDFKDLELLDRGFHIQLLNENTLVYLQDIADKDFHVLKSLDLRTGEERELKNGYFNSFQIIDKNKLAYTDKIGSLNNYLLSIYDLRKEDPITEIARTISSTSYYSPKDRLFYLDVVLPFEKNNSEYIYAIDLDSIK